MHKLICGRRKKFFEVYFLYGEKKYDLTKDLTPGKQSLVDHQNLSSDEIDSR